MRLEVNDSGTVVLPAELIQADPHTHLEAERQGSVVILRFPEPPVTKPACSLLNLPTIPTGPVDPAMTFRREDLYDDDNC